ncbi:hypothetical protein CK203_101812 [Vitis vinifera]|uniref:Uncharacterized protein n=1 Tax=Vitis vinifera TaxID=29760 RepID=A0A438ETB0_VITVI|nr:hypothetical protein CK203_101812 [Vitis vinifera]
MLLLRSQFVQMFGTLMLPMTLEKKLCPSMMTLEELPKWLDWAKKEAPFLEQLGQIAFLSNLASIAKQQSFGRAGLMSLAECIASAANDCQTEWREDAGPNIVQEESASESVSHNDKTVLLDALRFVVECGKQHFNPNYRLRVCERVLEAAASMVCTFNVPLEIPEKRIRMVIGRWFQNFIMLLRASARFQMLIEKQVAWSGINGLDELEFVSLWCILLCLLMAVQLASSKALGSCIIVPLYPISCYGSF